MKKPIKQRSFNFILANLIPICLARTLACPAGSQAFSYTDLKPKKGLRPVEYMEALAPLPNYIPGAKWGTIGEPIKSRR
jgi:hypothetical protein